GPDGQGVRGQGVSVGATGGTCQGQSGSVCSRAGLQVPLSPPTGSALSGGLRGVPADLLRGEVLLVGGDAPADAERIDHAAEPVAPEHVGLRSSTITGNEGDEEGAMVLPRRARAAVLRARDPWRCPAAPGYIARAGG